MTSAAGRTRNMLACSALGMKWRREDDVMFGVIGRLWRRKASMIVVVRGTGVPHKDDIVGIVTKEHIADSVVDSVRPYFDAEAAA